MTDVTNLKIGRASELAGENRWLYRTLEMLPGMLSWGFLLTLILLSFLLPAWTAIFIIAFDFYWLVKVIYLSLHLRSSYRRTKENMKINWWARLKQDHPQRWQDIWHLIVLPMYQEPYEVVEASFAALVRARYDQKKFIVVLSTEERAGNDAQEVAKKIERKFKGKFFKFYHTTHPKDIPGELAGKGSNETWATKIVKKEVIDKARIAYDKIIVSVFDIDTNVGPDYFSLLTYRYLSHPRPTRASFQPIPFYTNNIWEAPALARVISFSSTFWHMMQQERPEQQTTFSSHSMSFKTLVEIGFWQTNIVSEDSRIFWQCYMHFNGDYETVALFYPVAMDSNVAPTFWRTMLNQYRQQRRWGWGVENVPYILFGFLKNKKISLTKKIYRGFVTLEGFHSWATNSIIIFMMGWLPVLVGGAAFNVTLLSYNLPRITRILMTLALIGMISSMVLSINFLPPRPSIHGRYKYITMVLQWILLPFILIFFGSIPALDAQTRLLFGRYMGFWTTPKGRVAQKPGK